MESLRIMTKTALNFELPTPDKKTKVLALCDSLLSPSGVGTQALALFTGLINTGKYKVISLGGALKHSNYSTVQVNPDLIVKPVDGFGTQEQLRHLLLTEKPDVLFIFTDPNKFFWVWEMEDEIRQVCPIVYWHVWDNGPYPEFNKIWYESTDLINCLSHKTYELVKPHFPEKTNYIPHTFPKEHFYPMEQSELDFIVSSQFKGKEDWFKVLWVNRNAHRKVPGDVIASFSEFLDALQAKHGHRNALLIMHTDPFDFEGPNLVEVMGHFNLSNNVVFSTEKLPTQGMNVLHNICDTLINIAKNEGFGLSTLVQMSVGKPIISICTGGETRQVIDYRDGSENGVAIWPIVSQIMGSQPVPYLYEDFVSHQQVVDAFMKIFEMTPEDKVKMKEKVLEYVDHEFSYPKMISEWDRTIQEELVKFKKKTDKSWKLSKIENKEYVKQKTHQEMIAETLRQNNIELSKEVAKLPLNLTGWLMQNIKVTEVA